MIRLLIKSFLRFCLYLGVFCLISCQLLTSQALPSAQDKRDLALTIAKQGNLNPHVIATSSFNLLAFEPSAISGDTLRVYIEGDGSAWLNTQTPSSDPTPRNPIGLRLAVADLSYSSVYLARPCQYQIDAPPNPVLPCSLVDWTAGRFSEKVVNSLNDAINKLKIQFHAKNVILIGYSGGGALAILCAARRDDVIKIVTVAGNVSVAAWTKEMGLDSLKDSLDPIAFAAKVEGISQIHFLGTDDEIIPPKMISSYISYFPVTAPIKVVPLRGFDHQCCWVRDWPMLSNTFSETP